MKTSKSILLLFLVFISCCKNEKEVTQFKIAFGSCNNQVLENNMWNAIAENKPSVWIWGGDIIYSDTEDMLYMEQNYQKQKKIPVTQIL